MENRIVIIGAGPCGLGAAYRLQELGYTNWQIYERNNYVGGLSASFKDDVGFTWDIGGHVLFSHFEYFDRLIEKLLKNDYKEHERRAYIRIMDRWVPYPFQNNIRYLPVQQAWECLLGLLGTNPREVGNFREWIMARFGKGIAKYFMSPHNEKIWSHPLEEMSYNWIGERVSVVNVRRILANCLLRRDDISWGPNNMFRFPRVGGTGEIFRRLLAYVKERLVLSADVARIDVNRKELALTNGTKVSYDVLINTMPLDRFVTLAALEELSKAAGQLKHNSVLIVGLGFKRSASSDKCWVYFPENNSPFYRMTYFSNYSPGNVPSSDYTSLMCETAYSESKPYKKDSVIEDTIAGLINTGIIAAEDKKYIVSKYLIEADYAYPIPTLERDSALGLIQPFLKEKDVYSCGRFGAWKYEAGNMDHCLMQGKEAVDEILGATE